MRDMPARRAAAARGEVRYYTGRPCSRGHDSERYVTNGVCVECSRERGRREYEELQELRRQADAKEAST